MKTFASLAVLALLGEANCIQLEQQNRMTLVQQNRIRMRSQLKAHAGVRYENSEGPTMPDNGENDSGVMGREDDDSKTEHGWSNPLSWTDDGTDDQYVVNMEFPSLDAAYESYQPRDWSYDENIIDSFESEKDSKESVAKSKARWADEEKKRQEEYESLKAEFEGKSKKDKAETEAGDKKKILKNKNDKGKGDGQSTDLKKAKAAQDKIDAEDKAGDDKQKKAPKKPEQKPEEKDSEKPKADKKPKAAPEAEPAAEAPAANADLPGEVGGPKTPLDANGTPTKKVAKKLAEPAQDEAALPSEMGGPQRQLDANGTPQDKISKYAAVQTGHFTVNIDNMQIDVDGNEFDDDQSLVQKDPDQEDYDQDNSDPMSTLYE